MGHSIDIERQDAATPTAGVVAASAAEAAGARSTAQAAGEAPAAEAARVGPNAVLQLIAALDALGLTRLKAPVFAAAAASDWLAHPPETMTDERRVARLHQALRASVAPGQARVIMAEAGRLTAEYLLVHRIPNAAQRVLKLLPAGLASRMLVPAIRKHAWTFAGSGSFVATPGTPTVFELTHNPLCAGETASEPVCDWHAAVFQRLFQALVSPRTEVTETECEARGDDRCRFLLRW